jgi:hypothetical protein
MQVILLKVLEGLAARAAEIDSPADAANASSRSHMMHQRSFA